MDVTVAIATYGSADWIKLAQQRAIPSVGDQAPVIYRHDDTGLAAARNATLGKIETEYVVHLDADDELTPGYIDALATGSADVRAPAVQYLREGDRYGRGARVPRVAGHRHLCEADCLTAGNWLAVGAAAPVALLREVGGWRDWPVYEDWDLFLRCYLAGATFEAIPTAIYRAFVRSDSRNRGPTRAAKDETHARIVEANGGPWV